MEIKNIEIENYLLFYISLIVRNNSLWSLVPAYLPTWNFWIETFFVRK